MSYLWTKNGVPGTQFAVSDKVWIDQELFTDFFHWLSEHFMADVASHWLLLDGRSI